MAYCLLPVVGSMALVGRCEEAQKRKLCSSNQKEQEHSSCILEFCQRWGRGQAAALPRCHWLLSSPLHPKKGIGMIFAIRNS